MSEYQHKKTKNGKENPAYVDMLDEDGTTPHASIRMEAA